VVPDLARLAAPSRLARASLHLPGTVRVVRDGSVLVAENNPAAEAKQVFLDDSKISKKLPAATTNSTCVLAIDDDPVKGLITVSADKGTVERTGVSAWKRPGLQKPAAAVIVGDVLLVTESEAGQVLRLSLLTGETLAAFGRERLRKPTGIALGPDGTIVVVDPATNGVHVFTMLGQSVRSFGEAVLRCVRDVCVDSMGRMYVADHQSVVVLDGANGAVLHSIAIEGMPQGVTLTPRGEIIVSVWNSKLQGIVMRVGPRQ
jgi:hypothetical protein